MRIARIVGTVTLSRCLPSFEGARLKLAVPETLESLAGRGPARGDEIVVWDELGGGDGGRIAMSEGAEAAQPFRPQLKPVDAYNAALLDNVSLSIVEV